MRDDLEPRFDDVVLVVSELVANSVRHTDTGEIHVAVQPISRRVRIEVADFGTGISDDRRGGSGLGLMIVEKLSDRWGYQDGESFTVWAELDLAGEHDS